MTEPEPDPQPAVTPSGAASSWRGRLSPIWLAVLASVGMSAAALGVALSQGGDPDVDRFAVRSPEEGMRAPLRQVLPEQSEPSRSPLPRARLRVYSDGCGVIRSEFPGGPPDGLTWTVLDAGGFQVLGRNAEGETRYRYYRPGTYTVVLKAWGGSSYVPVSNTVTIRC